jgi:AcrR family transcriptional regulator
LAVWRDECPAATNFVGICRFELDAGLNRTYLSIYIRQRMATAAPLRTPPLKPEDWIVAAFQRLAREGIDSLRVEVLARDLGVSKGSFYWHFRDRDELLAQMLERWEKNETEWLASEEFRGPERPNPAMRWARFVERASDLEIMQAEIAVHAWARRDRGVAQRLAAVEERKTHVTADVLHDIGFAKESADRWAGMILLVYQGWLDRATRSAHEPGASERPEALGPILSEMVLAASARS